MAEFKQSIIICIAALLTLTPNAVNAVQANLYPQKNGLCSSFQDYNHGGYDYVCGVRTGTIQADQGAIYRVAIYTGIPRESNPKEKIRPKYVEYYEWTGYTNVRLDEQGCLQPVDNSEAGTFITSNNCPPSPYPALSDAAPDIPNPYYLVQKSRESNRSGQTQSSLQPDLNNAELSVPFVSSADTGTINDKIVGDGAAFLGGATGGFRPVVADQVATTTPVEDDAFSEWGPLNFRRKLKQRRRSVERVDGDVN